MRSSPRRTTSALASVAGSVLLLLALTSPAVVEAAAAARVESVQIPAWLVRAGERMPVDAGMPLEAGDTLYTGANARALLRLAEGSVVKLGPDAELTLQALKASAKPGGLFTGLLDVVKGAFRFTTTLLSKAHRRNVDVRVANVTAGIRGTDVWGKAATDRDIVCLIEGEVSVQRGNDAPITMSDPLTFYVAPKGAQPLPVRPVDPDQLQRWAQETEIEANGPVLTAEGAWAVYLESLSSREAAERSRATLAALGYPAQVEAAVVDTKTFYRVAVIGFRDLRGAAAFKDSEAKALGFRSPWAAQR